MDEKDWIFGKWPVWLRWICVLPLAVLGSVILPILSSISYSYIGYDLSSGLGKTIMQYASLAGFMAIVYTCVPKFKEIITGVISIILAMLFAITIYLYIMQDAGYNLDFFITALSLIGSFVFGICMSIEHGRLSKQNEYSSSEYGGSYYIDSEDIEG